MARKRPQGPSNPPPSGVRPISPLWTVYPQWGWGTEDGARASSISRATAQVKVLNGHIPSDAEGEGSVTSTRALDRVPSPRRAAPSPDR